jgi:hypothetical protein
VCVRGGGGGERAICRNPHNSLESDFSITKQLGDKHTFSQNVVSTEKFIILLFT